MPPPKSKWAKKCQGLNPYTPSNSMYMHILESWTNYYSLCLCGYLFIYFYFFFLFFANLENNSRSSCLLLALNLVWPANTSNTVSLEMAWFLQLLGLLAALQWCLVLYGLNGGKWFYDGFPVAQTAAFILECNRYPGTNEWRKFCAIKCKEMLLPWNKAQRELTVQFAIKLQVTCYYCSELLLSELGSAPAVQ